MTLYIKNNKMKMNTINVEDQNYRRGLSLFNIVNKKATFSTISTSPKNIKLFRIRNKNTLSQHKKPLKTEIRNNSTFFKNSKLKSNIRMVNDLIFEENINNILITDLELEKQKEKIDKNKSIKLLRLGLYKKKEKNEIDNESIVEKEKENEEDLEKIDAENKEKERRIEKKFKEKLYVLEKIRNECQNLNEQINEINKNLEEYNLEENVLNNYGEEFDKMYQQKLNIEKEKEILEISEEGSESNRKKKNKNFEQLNKLMIFKQKREDKKKLIKENKIIKQSIKQKLENDLIKKRELCNQSKKELYIIRKDLINRYHLKLYEGLDFHGEGLSKIIKDIWNLGVNVNIDFMPSYLDGAAIDFLFQKAKQSIELNKIREVIKDNESELTYYLKDWRNNNKEVNFILNKNTNYGLNNNKIENSDEKKNDMNENELFKTKVGDISLSYLESFPKTKQFMLKYRKKHKELFQKDIPQIEVNYAPFKSLNIPLKIVEKNKHLEKLKYLLEIKIQQNKQKDKKEVERLNYEFFKNRYKERYEVNAETVFGALFGEDKKNEMLIYFSRLEKEYRDSQRIIQFHNKINLKLK